MSDPIVSVETGKLRGTIEKDINGKVFYSFRGIPYGKPTSGDARFKAPEPAEPWAGILDANKDGDACFSRNEINNKLLTGSENCLVLNVYTPTISTNNNVKKPVMVWIHGGGFILGSNSTEFYSPEFLVAEDVVLVAINYRLHVLGFLSLEDPSLEVPGNNGLKDMVLALKWVQKNIENFGGDPKNVTIFGESAGGAAVHYLILSPKTEGLFHKAIIQSGCAINSWARGRRIAVELGQQLGLTTTNEKELLEHFRKTPVQELFEAAEKIKDEFVASFKRPHGPVVERPSTDAFLTQEPIEIIKSGKYNHVSILIGYTNREGMLWHFMKKEFTPHTDFEAIISHMYNIERGSETSKLIAEKIKSFYYGNKQHTDGGLDAYNLLESDTFFITDILNTIINHSKNAKNPIYLYRMSIESGLNLLKAMCQITEPGAAHSDDMGYLFKNYLTPEITPGSVEDIGRRRFCKIWSNFARYGRPSPHNNDDLINIEWKPVTTEQLHFVDIGKELTSGVDPEKERLEFWNDIAKMCPKRTNF